MLKTLQRLSETCARTLEHPDWLNKAPAALDDLTMLRNDDDDYQTGGKTVVFPACLFGRLFLLDTLSFSFLSVFSAQLLTFML